MIKVNRRELLAAGGAALLAGMPGRAAAEAGGPIDIRAIKRVIEVKGRAANVLGLKVNGRLGGLDIRYSERFQARLTNETDSETLVHWHGLTPPVAQDGVPMLSQPVLGPGKSYDYDFPITSAGTHWMHSHVGLQEQSLLAAPLIVRETAEPVLDEREHVVMLHDFTFRDPAEILAELQGGGGAHAGHVMNNSLAMPVGPPLNDVAFDAYLANDRTLDDPEVVGVERGAWLKLRIINGAAASNMWVDLGPLEGGLVAVDGHAIHPLNGSRFPLAIAQRADVRVRIPAAGGAFPVLFHPEGAAARTGIVLATAGAAITKISGEGEIAPAVDLSFEARMRAIAEPPREPASRSATVMLTGGGGDYSWGLNGKSSMHDTLFTVREGDRVEVLLRNMTNMAHPMHLHGHYFKVVAVGGTRFDGAVRDTVLVPPMEAVTIAFDANNPGTWAFHCHHIYHMNAGMMGAMAYASAA